MSIVRYAPVLVVLAITAFAAEPVRAQEKETPAEHFAAMRAKVADDVRERLKSDDLAAIAWAAHTSAEFRLDNCVPELRAKLVAIANVKGEPRDFAALALLDALIQANAKVPGEELVPFLGDCTRCSVFTLFCQDARKNLPQLVALYRAASGESKISLACGDLIVDTLMREDPTKAADFALAVLRERTLLVIAVHDAGAKPDALDPFEFWRWRSGCVRLKPPPDFPPTIQYGPAGSRASRNEANSLADAGEELSVSTLKKRSNWMRRLLGRLKGETPDDVPLFIRVTWADLATLQAAEAEHRSKIAAQHRELMAMYVEKKVVPAETMAQITPVIETIYVDHRAQQTPLLPASK